MYAAADLRWACRRDASRLRPASRPVRRHRLRDRLLRRRRPRRPHLPSLLGLPHPRLLHLLPRSSPLGLGGPFLRGSQDLLGRRRSGDLVRLVFQDIRGVAGEQLTAEIARALGDRVLALERGALDGGRERPRVVAYAQHRDADAALLAAGAHHVVDGLADVPALVRGARGSDTALMRPPSLPVQVRHIQRPDIPARIGWSHPGDARHPTRRHRTKGIPCPASTPTSPAHSATPRSSA